MDDRRVHATYNGMEVVRYDRAGKWYLEPTLDGLPRQRVTVRKAAAAARWGVENAEGLIRFGVLGGSRFEALVRGAGAP